MQSKFYQAVCLTLLSGGVFSTTGNVQAQSVLNVTIADLGSPGSASGNVTSPTAINESGQITGSTRGFTADVGDRAYIWTPTIVRGSTGTFLDLGNINHQPYGGESHGECINNSAVVSGHFSENPAGAPYDVFRYASGTVDIIPYFGGAQLVPSIYGPGINDTGIIAGWSENKWFNGSTWGPFWCAYRATSGTSKTLLPPLSGGSHDNSYAYAINNFGQIVGKSVTSTGAYRATIWQPSGTTPVDLGLGDNSIACSINSNGDVVGQYQPVSGASVFLWKPTTAHATTGTVTNLGLVSGNNTVPFHINDSDQIVGYYVVGSASYAFLYDTAHGGYRTLQTTIGGVIKSLDEALWINNHGQIVGAYNMSTTPTSSAFLIQPGY